MQGIITTNLYPTRNKNDNGIGIVGGLDIHGFNVVFDGSDTFEFTNDGFRSGYLLTFKGEDRLGALVWLKR